MMRKLFALGAAAVWLTVAPLASSGRGDDRGKGHDVGSFRQIATLWLASQGNAASIRNVLVQVDSRGQILREIFLPADVDAPGGRITSNGFKGIDVSSDGRYLLVAVQRPYRGKTTASTGLNAGHDVSAVSSPAHPYKLLILQCLSNDPNEFTWNLRRTRGPSGVQTRQEEDVTTVGET